MLTSLQRLPDPGPPEQDPVHAADDRAVPVRVVHPGAGHRPRRRGHAAARRPRRAACWASCSCSPAARSPSSRCSRSGSCRTSPLDHHADPHGGDPQAGAVAGSRAPSASARSPSGPATSPSASPSCSRPAWSSCSTTAAAASSPACSTNLDLVPNFTVPRVLLIVAHPHRRHRPAHVDGRAHHPAGHRQRHVDPDLHLGGQLATRRRAAGCRPRRATPPWPSSSCCSSC